MSRRRGIGICMLTGLTLVLAGCSPVGDIWAKIGKQGEIVFSLCDDLSATELRVRVQGTEGAAWTAVGSHDFRSGDVFAYGVDVEGLTTHTGPAALGPMDVLVVSVLPDADSDESSLRGVFDTADLNAAGLFNKNHIVIHEKS